MAVEPENVQKEMQAYFKDLEILLNSSLNEIEVFYFASIIHLRMGHIHPFRDGMPLGVFWWTGNFVICPFRSIYRPKNGQRNAENQNAERQRKRTP